MKLKFFKNTETMRKSQYTAQENAELLEIAKTTNNVYRDSRKFAKKIGKSEKSVYNRIYRERMSLGIVRSKAKPVEVVSSSKKTTFFYTKEQVDLITKELNAGLNPTEITRKFHMSWGLSFPCLYQKVARIKRELAKQPVSISEPVPVAKIVVEKPVKTVQKMLPPVQEMELQMSEGSTFDCKPSRVTICKDHIRIYF